MAAEEFRVTTLEAMGRDWLGALPKIPSTKAEVRVLIRRQMKINELTGLQQLAQLGSMSSTLIRDLILARDIVREACGMLQQDFAAQITLPSIFECDAFPGSQRG